MTTRAKSAVRRKKVMQAANVLVVDDEQNVAKTLAAILERENYSVTVASMFKEAQKLIEKEQFDAAVIDLRLDENDGLDLVRMLREQQGGRCSTIVLTGYGSLETAQEALRAEAYDYLTKPCDADDLKAAVARAVERSSLIHKLEANVNELNEAQVRIKELAARREEDLSTAVAVRTAQLEQANHELERAYEALEQYVQELERSKATIIELSAPCLRVRERVLLFPLIGILDDQRIELLSDQVLGAVRSQRAEAVVLDCTGLAEMDDRFAEETSKIVAAARLLGAVTVITGLSTESCDALVKRGVTIGTFSTAGDLQQGIELAERLLQA